MESMLYTVLNFIAHKFDSWIYNVVPSSLSMLTKLKQDNDKLYMKHEVHIDVMNV